MELQATALTMVMAVDGYDVLPSHIDVRREGTKLPEHGQQPAEVGPVAEQRSMETWYKVMEGEESS